MIRPMRYTLLLIFLLLAVRPLAAQTDSRHRFHFTEPACVWEEQLPLGNGRIGLMSDGRPTDETITLNEISMWSGSPQETANPVARESLPEIRRLLFAGEYRKAEQLVYQTFVCGGAGSNHGQGANAPYGAYQLFGRLHLKHRGISPEVTDYVRSLDIDSATAETRFRSGGVLYTRRYYTSFADDVAVVELTASRNGTLSFDMEWSRPENARYYADSIAGVVIEGALPDGQGGAGVRYRGEARIFLPDGGSVTCRDAAVELRGATRAYIIIALATSFGGNDEQETVRHLMHDAVTHRPLAELWRAHTTAFDKQFGQSATIRLGTHPNEQLSIPERLRLFHQNGDDFALSALYYKYGLYLLASSTRVGGLPPNLQGLWAHQTQTPWNGDYHLNINLQMNYWPAESGNLSHLHTTLADWTLAQVESGRRTARDFYGADGWVTHILGNVWQFTAPGEHPSWGATNTSAAWLCQHLYRHYLYSQDTTYLRSVYPAMREAARFYADVLVTDPRSSWLVTAPTTSPENAYISPSGDVVHVAAGSTMDNQIIRELFDNTLSTARTLSVTDALLGTLAVKRHLLMPTTIAADGRIMEWLEPYEEVEPHHRHVSHLYALYPGNQISTEHTPDLATAARKTLEVRGDDGTSWSMAWKICFWARLGDGDRAWSLLSRLLRPATVRGMSYEGYGSGTLPNLFSAHPPFQIDGNLGGAAGIMEMLVQSEAGHVELLPALPSDWSASGSVSHAKVVGNALISFTWKEGRITDFTLRASAPYRHKLLARRGLDSLNFHVMGTGSANREGDYWVFDLHFGDVIRAIDSSRIP